MTLLELTAIKSMKQNFDISKGESKVDAMNKDLSMVPQIKYRPIPDQKPIKDRSSHSFAPKLVEKPLKELSTKPSNIVFDINEAARREARNASMN